MPDDILVTGIRDDVAVVGTALRIVHPELERYKQWRARNDCSERVKEKY